MRYLIAYDISNASRIRRINRYLLSIAQPLQNSFFEVMANPAQLRSLILHLQELMNEKDDDIRIFPYQDGDTHYRLGTAVHPDGIQLI